MDLLFATVSWTNGADQHMETWRQFPLFPVGTNAHFTMRPDLVRLLVRSVLGASSGS